MAGKDIKTARLVASGGRAALACLGLLVKLGLPRENIWSPTSPAWSTRAAAELMDEDKAVLRAKTELRSLAEVIEGADVFLGLSAGGVLKKDMVARMAPRPLIFALANPIPRSRPRT